MNNNRGKSIYDVPSSSLIQAASKIKKHDNHVLAKGACVRGKVWGKFMDKCNDVVFPATATAATTNGK